MAAAWFTFYLFDRHGTCLSYTEWKRPVKAENALHEQRNLFGVLWSLRQLCAALDPSEYVLCLFCPRRHAGMNPLRAGACSCG